MNPDFAIETLTWPMDLPPIVVAIAMAKRQPRATNIAF